MSLWHLPYGAGTRLPTRFVDGVNESLLEPTLLLAAVSSATVPSVVTFGAA
jgi:hypothetical protein